jgi:hypothetical protein
MELVVKDWRDPRFPVDDRAFTTQFDLRSYLREKRERQKREFTQGCAAAVSIGEMLRSLGESGGA